LSANDEAISTTSLLRKGCVNCSSAREIRVVSAELGIVKAIVDRILVKPEDSAYDNDPDHLPTTFRPHDMFL
jgi:hypothetical protein